MLKYKVTPETSSASSSLVSSSSSPVSSSSSSSSTSTLLPVDPTFYTNHLPIDNINNKPSSRSRMPTRQTVMRGEYMHAVPTRHHAQLYQLPKLVKKKTKTTTSLYNSKSKLRTVKFLSPIIKRSCRVIILSPEEFSLLFSFWRLCCLLIDDKNNFLYVVWQYRSRLIYVISCNRRFEL